MFYKVFNYGQGFVIRLIRDSEIFSSQVFRRFLVFSMIQVWPKISSIDKRLLGSFTRILVKKLFACSETNVGI